MVLKINYAMPVYFDMNWLHPSFKPYLIKQ